MFTTTSSSPSTFLLVLCTSILLFSAPLTTSNQHLCDKEDLGALLEIKRSLGNPSFLSSWNVSTPCCDWYSGIYCDAGGGGRVTLFSLQHTDVTGAIPPAIGGLSHLRTIIIAENAILTGTIPPSIGKLKNLSFLRIAENPRLTGPIPKSLCLLPKLEELRLSANNLTGPIPGCLGKNLSYIDLSINNLFGYIPASFLRGSTAASVTLDLSGNSLTGPIPPSLGDVPFEFIDLSVNRLTDASVLFGEEKKTKTMFLANNELWFDLSKVSFPLGLEQVTLDHNLLTGSIPQQIKKLENISYLDVSYNNLCGSIPRGKYLKLLYRSLFEHNKCLCGSPLNPCH